jgi:hypothetical protein
LAYRDIWAKGMIENSSKGNGARAFTFHTVETIETEDSQPATIKPNFSFGSKQKNTPKATENECDKDKISCSKRNPVEKITASPETKRNRIFEKLLSDLHLSPRPRPSRPAIEVNELKLEPSARPISCPKKKTSKDYLKDILQPKPTRSVSVTEPYEKLTEKYGRVESRIIGSGATANVR